MESYLSTYLAQSADAASALAADTRARLVLHDMATALTATLRAGGKLLIAGNGGSAADAQHLAAECVSRLNYNRAPLAALALSESGPILTACGNDYGFETIFARQVEALGRPGDALLALSTSGNSKNLILAAEAARALGMACCAFTGQAGGAVLGRFDHVLRAPSPHAQIVQQLHITACHALLGVIERAMFPQ